MGSIQDQRVEDEREADAPPKRYMHTLIIVSEHEGYDDIEDVVRDAVQGDAILRSWARETIAEDVLTDEERDFFAPMG